ncbi:CoA pyrophosphatase [Rhodobacteraceae bacterium RKSG542]|nr:CoA pyrophosphatase [Pseudovibrio flavus]
MYSVSNFAERAKDSVVHSAELIGGDHILNPEFKPYLDGGLQLKDAAVLVLAMEGANGPSILLTQRTSTLRAHAGQIAFPGGKVDEEDEGVIGAALREAQEEVGLDPSLVDPIGTLGHYVTGSGYRVSPVLATLRSPARFSLNPDEVEETFEVPLSFVMNLSNYQRHSREIAGKARYFYAVPYEEHYIWGITAGILRCVCNMVYAR